MLQYPMAFFVFCPRRLTDLFRPHLIEQRKPYSVEKIIKIAKIDYENFTADFCAERWFIEDNAVLCKIAEDGVWHSILIQQYGKTDGILVMAKGQSYPQWASYMPGNGDG